MLIDCMLRALEISWLYVTLIAIVFIIIIINGGKFETSYSAVTR